MTPDKVADNLLADWGDPRQKPILRDAIATALHEARNQALEEAAVDWESSNGFDLYGVAAQIRALKHKDGQP